MDLEPDSLRWIQRETGYLHPRDDLAVLQRELEKLGPCRARLWSFTVSHGQLVLRLTQFRDSRLQNVQVIAEETAEIHTRESWDNCTLVASVLYQDGVQLWCLEDKACGFRIICAVLSIRENHPPFF